MNMRNMYDLVETKVEGKNINKMAPQWPFRLLVVGPSGCGKTNMVTNLATDYLYYDNLHILTKKLDEGLYAELKNFILAVNELKKKEGKPTIGMYMYTDPSQLPEINSNDEELQHLFIFDDMVCEKHQERMNEYFIRSRKNNCSCIYQTQSFNTLDPELRGNCDYACFFKVRNTNIISAHDQYGQALDKDRFKEIFNKSVNAKPPNNFFIIDLKPTSDKELRFRQGWNNLWLDKDEQ